MTWNQRKSWNPWNIVLFCSLHVWPNSPLYWPTAVALSSVLWAMDWACTQRGRWATCILPCTPGVQRAALISVVFLQQSLHWLTEERNFLMILSSIHSTPFPPPIVLDDDRDLGGGSALTSHWAHSAEVAGSLRYQLYECSPKSYIVMKLETILVA